MNRYYFILLCSVCLASTSQILLKVAVRKNYKSHLREYLNPWVICGYGLIFCSTFLTMLSCKGLAYKNVQVMESLGVVLVLFLGRIFFKEKLTLRKVIGICIILIGICIYYL